MENRALFSIIFSSVIMGEYEVKRYTLFGNQFLNHFTEAILIGYKIGFGGEIVKLLACSVIYTSPRNDVQHSHLTDYHGNTCNILCRHIRTHRPRIAEQSKFYL